MDWDYELIKDRYLITMENGKKYFRKVEEIDNLQKQLKISTFEAIEMWLEDEGYLINEEQELLCQQTKDTKASKIIGAKTDTEKKKTQKERVVKENPTKEMIIAEIAKILPNFATNVIIENKGKLITFSINTDDFKLDLVQKRKKKN